MEFLQIGFSQKQRFIFSSNKLGVNIGASYIIDQVLLGSLLHHSIKACFGENLKLNYWELSGNQIFENDDAPIGIVNIGGGNAILAFRQIDNLKKFVQDYSSRILEGRYGIQLELGQAALKDINLKSIGLALENSRRNRRNQNYFQESIPLHSLFEKCPFSKGCLEFDKSSNNTMEYSAEYGCKIRAQQSAKVHYKNLLSKSIGENFIVTDHINDYDPKDDSRYNAIVHIDGNGIGQLFNSIDDIETLRSTSIKFQEILESCLIQSYKVLIQVHDKLLEDYPNKVSGLFPQKEEKTLLPLRFIVNAGDDITFICSGAFAILLSEVFIKNFTGECKIAFPKIDIGACAGIVIAKTKSPFYRMYELACELTDRAKEHSRLHDNDSFLDFYVKFDSSITTLSDIPRKAKDAYQPYQLPHGIQELKNGHFEMLEEIPRNKISRLRDVIINGSVKEKNNLIQEYKIKLETKLDEDKLDKLPYLDYISLIDWLPPEIYKDGH